MIGKSEQSGGHQLEILLDIWQLAELILSTDYTWTHFKILYKNWSFTSLKNKLEIKMFFTMPIWLIKYLNYTNLSLRSNLSFYYIWNLHRWYGITMQWSVMLEKAGESGVPK